MGSSLCPVQGCQIPVDVVLRSSDQVLIGAHKANLDHHSDGFPSADATSDSKEPVDLTENTSTLNLLMQFMHKTQYPDVFDLEEDPLFELANAAEKYVVHAAIGACGIYIRATVQKYPMKALAYAVGYNYPKIADVAAPATMCKEISVMKSVLSNEGLVAWLQYKATYLEEINGILFHQKPSPRTWAIDLCTTWAKYYRAIQAEIPRPTDRYLSTNLGTSLNVEGCQIPVDVVLRSSDQVLIGAHKANLDHYSDGFPSADATSDSKDPVDLTEDGSTLKLLMQFTHKTQYPDVFDLEEDSLFELANAAEKYFIHAAAGVCSVYIRATYHEYPMKALAYAVGNHYPKLADIAAPKTMAQELSTMRNVLDSEGLFAWLQYKTTYLETVNGILFRRQPSSRTWGLSLSVADFPCSTWDEYFPGVQEEIPRPTDIYLSSNLGPSLNSLLQKDKPICDARNKPCKCDTALEEWKEDLVGAIDSVPAFSTYLSSRTT